MYRYTTSHSCIYVYTPIHRYIYIYIYLRVCSRVSNSSQKSSIIEIFEKYAVPVGIFHENDKNNLCRDETTRKRLSLDEQTEQYSRPASERKGGKVYEYIQLKMETAVVMTDAGTNIRKDIKFCV